MRCFDRAIRRRRVAPLQIEFLSASAFERNTRKNDFLAASRLALSRVLNNPIILLRETDTTRSDLPFGIEWEVEILVELVPERYITQKR